MRSNAVWLAGLAAAAVSPAALGQFGVPASTNVRERLVGKLLSAEGAPRVASGDQVGAFFDNTLVGVFTFSDSDEFSFVIFGDNPNTATKEGPAAGDAVQFRFFDASTNETRTDVQAENLQGERFNFRYQGVEVPPLDDIPFPIDLTPTRNINLRIGVSQGGGGDDADRLNKYDVDGNGKVDEADAAMVLRLVLGAGRGVSEDVLDAADVDGDGRITTRDAIEIMRNK